MEMLLQAKSYSFEHPVTSDKIIIQAPLWNEFMRIVSLLDELDITH